ncbi:MAG: DUF4296 domain-containing protein [Flavobacteriales bacterium]|nr:DUF4296 domain-containing protein [Flavobacteriales bacterium]
MMRPLLVAIGLFLAACGGGEPIPDTPLDRATFEQVLAGSLLIEARTKQDLQVDPKAGASPQAAYDELFRKHGVTEADFKATYNAYLAKPEELKAVYQDVLNDLQQRADSLKH